MASSKHASQFRGDTRRPLPEYLRFLRPGIYEDGIKRLWMVVVLQNDFHQAAVGKCFGPQSVCSSRTLHLWHMPQLPQNPPFSDPEGILPLMWQLQPGRQYRGTDSKVWEIIDHNLIGFVEQLVLRCWFVISD